MARRRTSLTHPRQRSVLTDMLPFEVPPTFSNRGFYRFLRNSDVHIDEKRVCWISGTAALDPVMNLLFGVKAATPIAHQVVIEWGKTKARRSLPIGACNMGTIPFNFHVAHNLDGRTLSAGQAIGSRDLIYARLE